MGQLAHDASSFESFTAQFSGEVIKPSDPRYDDSRQGWNAMIDKQPTLIVHPRGTADVIIAVNYAREAGLPVAVRCGGHSYAGHSVCDDGLLIDLCLMKGVRVDAAGRTARANGGVLWDEFDHETQAFGLATPGGRISTTGIGGFTLGGGYGWLSPKYGLACDNLVAADVVTAAGQLVTASEHENEELLWGLRGGASNFGVVTSFVFRLHSVGPLITGGMLLYPVHQAPEVLRAYRDYVDTGPDELSTAFGLFSALPEEFLPPELRGQTLLGILVTHCGDPSEGEAAVRPLKEIGPPAVDMVGPIPYLVLQRLLDEAAPRGWRWYSGGEHLAGLTDEAIDVIVDHAPQGLDPLSQLIVFRHGGAVSRVRDGETAVANRDAAWLLHPLASWLNPADDERHIAWRNGVMGAMEPFRTGGLYLNWTPDEDQNALDTSGNERMIHGYGPQTYARLLALKEKYDPTNMFRFNPNIRPAAAAHVG